MKLLLLTFVATVSYVNAGKTLRLLAALNGGVLPGMNGGVLPGMNGGVLPGMNGGMMPVMNGGMMPVMNGGMMAGMNGGMMAGMNGGIPGMIAGGLRPPMVAGGGVGVFGQPQFAQVVPAVALPAPNVYPVPAVNVLPFMGVPQMAPMNPLQQQQLPAGITGGAVQQQPLQPDPLRRFRRHVMKQDVSKTTVDTQIPAPTDTVTTAPCEE